MLANQQITIQFAFEMPNYCHLMKKYDYNLFFFNEIIFDKNSWLKIYKKNKTKHKYKGKQYTLFYN